MADTEDTPAVDERAPVPAPEPEVQGPWQVQLGARLLKNMGTQGNIIVVVCLLLFGAHELFMRPTIEAHSDSIETLHAQNAHLEEQNEACLSKADDAQQSADDCNESYRNLLLSLTGLTLPFVARDDDPEEDPVDDP